MEIGVFKTISEYQKDIENLEEMPYFHFGEPLNYKKIKNLSLFYNRFTPKHNIKILVKTLEYFCEVNNIPTLTLEISNGEKDNPAHYVLGKDVIYIDESLLKSSYWYALYLLCHELSHHLIYIDNNMNNTLMDLSHEFKEKYAINKDNNLLLPIELAANSLNHYLLKDIEKKTGNFFLSWLDKFNLEKSKLF